MMVIPGSHLGPIYSHHTDGLFVGGMDVLDAEQAGCDFASAKALLGVAGSVSFHHGRAVHGSDLNRSRRPVCISVSFAVFLCLSMCLCVTNVLSGAAAAFGDRVHRSRRLATG